MIMLIMLYLATEAKVQLEVCYVGAFFLDVLGISMTYDLILRGVC